MNKRNYDPSAHNLVANETTGEIIGCVTQWNYHGLGEAIVQYLDGSASSELFKELTFPNGGELARQWLNAKEDTRNSYDGAY